MEYLASSLETFLRMTVMGMKKKQEQKKRNVWVHDVHDVTEHAEGVIDCTAWKKLPVKINMICTHSIKQCTDKSFLGNYTLTDILWQDELLLVRVCYACLKFKCVLKPISDIMGPFFWYK